MLSEEQSQKIFRQVSDIAERRLGTDCTQRHPSRLLEALERRAQLCGFASIDCYLDFLITDDLSAEWQAWDEILTIQKTEFFRENSQMEHLKNVLLPKLKAQKMKQGCNKIRVWSCGCATGEEAYSLAIYLTEIFTPASAWDIKVLASDIHQGALSQANQGHYSIASMANVPSHYRQKYFSYTDDNDEGYYRVLDSVKSLVQFRSINLMLPRYPVKSVFDYILCRNLLIYMTNENQACIIQKLRKTLQPSGYLLLGHSEHLQDEIDFRRDKYNIFQAPGD